MAYNGFPATYQPVYYQQYQPMVQQQQNTGIIWVSGEAGAKAYLVAPNTTVQLWDSETQRIFLKSADASGMPSMKVLEYTIRDQTAGNAPLAASGSQQSNSPAYATHAEIDALSARIDALNAELHSMTQKGAATDE